MEAKVAMITAERFLDYGLAGAVILCLLAFLFLFGRWFVKHMESMAAIHREERAEWRETVREVTQMQDARQQETNTILNNLTNVIDGRLFQGNLNKLRGVK